MGNLISSLIVMISTYSHYSNKPLLHLVVTYFAVASFNESLNMDFNCMA
jgi:hypothetical protein